MRNLMTAAILAVAACLANVDAASAEDKGRTNLQDVPAAFKAMGMTQSNVLPKKKTQQIRGQAIWFETNLWFTTAAVHGGFNARGDVVFFKVWADPNIAHIEIYD